MKSDIIMAKKASQKSEDLMDMIQSVASGDIDIKADCYIKRGKKIECKIDIEKREPTT